MNTIQCPWPGLEPGSLTPELTFNSIFIYFNKKKKLLTRSSTYSYNLLCDWSFCCRTKCGKLYPPNSTSYIIHICKILQERTRLAFSNNQSYHPSQRWFISILKNYKDYQCICIYIYAADSFFTWQEYPGRRAPPLKHLRVPPSLIAQNPGFTWHVSLWHSSHGRHVNGVPEQTPFEHWSLLVQATLSSHGKALLFVQASLLALLQSCWTEIYHSGNIRFLKLSQFYVYPLLLFFYHPWWV